MGTTQKPLKIYVTEASLLPLLQPLVDRGHTVTLLEIGEYDVVVGTRAHRLPPEAMRDMPERAIDMMVRGVRDRVYPPTKGRKK